MNRRNFMTMTVSVMVLAAAFSICGCSTSGDGEYYDKMAAEESSSELTDSPAPDDEPGGSGNSHAGVVTAGEWNDLNHWAFWSALMLGNDYGDKSEYWQFYTNNRVAVEVADYDGNALVGATVKLLRQSEGRETTLWETVTDNHGKADCWVGLHQKEEAHAASLAISINDEIMEGHPAVCQWDSLAQQTTVNRYVVAASMAEQQADIAFIVDATGSMGDEIEFLKDDLEDIINKTASLRPTVKMRTAALFYRDEDDEYLTRHQDFTDNLKQTASFVGNQRADGGGDYPEAVHSALDGMLQKLSWNTRARTRIAFLLLDAPAHHEDAIIASLQKSVTLCAKMGIRIIPVAASGVDKNTEFMLRFFASVTGGTYVFLTDDSGVGGSHLKASVGEYKVELLNNLLIRLISYYTE